MATGMTTVEAAAVIAKNSNRTNPSWARS